MIECDITRPYLFISYSHEDNDKVKPIINELIKMGYRLWFDGGIPVGKEWPETVAVHIKESYCVVFFVSQNFCDSKNCKREVNYAIDLDKTMFAIYLEECKQSPGLKMQLGTIQSCSLKNDSSETFIERILSNSIFKNKGLFLDRYEIEKMQPILVSQNSLIHSQTVAIGILKHKGNVLMLKRRNPEGNLIWGFPTSNVKPNEDPSVRIVKEFYGETGIRTKVFKQLGTRLHPDTKAICYYYALEYIDGLLENRDDYENAEARWIETTKYKLLISSDLFDPVMEYLSEQPIEVVMCIVTHNDKILLVHRAEKDPNLSWAFPGGTVEKGENIFQTAVRELKEETNIDGEVISLIGDRVHPYSKKHMAYVALKPTSFEIVVGDKDLDKCQWFDISDINAVFGSPVYEKVNHYLSSIQK